MPVSSSAGSRPSRSVVPPAPSRSYRIREYRAPGEYRPEPLIDTSVDTGYNELTGLALTGLSNDRPYRFTVQAINSAGAGPESAPSTAVTPLAVTPLGAPDRPLNVQATSMPGGIALVSWDPPTANAGSAAVTGFEIVASPGGVVRSVGPDTESIEFDGLRRGTQYTFRVRADSDSGTRAESLPSGQAIVADAPDPPQNPLADARAKPGSVVVTWEPPADDGGASLANYEVCLLGGSCQLVHAARTQASFSGAEPGRPLTFEVTAHNRAGLDSAAARTNGRLVLRPAIGAFSVSPGRARAKPGKSVTFTVKLKNTGTAPARSVKVCAKAPARFTRTSGCRGRSSLAPGGTFTAKIKVKVSRKANRKARGKVSFKVTSDNAGGKTVRKRITVRK